MQSKDPNYAACRHVLADDKGPFIIPAAILSEIGWFLEQRLPRRVESAFLDDLQMGAYTVDWTPEDVMRIRQLTDRYEDLRLGLADAAAVACAERYGGRVLTINQRHFSV